MFRTVWMLTSFLIAAVFSLLAGPLLPDILAALLPSRVPQSVFDLLSQSALLTIANGLTLACLTATLLGFGGLAVFDMVGQRRALKNLSLLKADSEAGQQVTKRDFLLAMEEAGDLQRLAEAYGHQLHQTALPGGDMGGHFYASQSAARFFGAAVMIQERLLAGMFRLVAWLLAGSGLCLFLASLVMGIDYSVFESRLPPTGAVSSGLLLSLEVGLMALLICILGALFMAATIAVATHSRTRQCRALVTIIDGIFFMNRPANAMPDGARISTASSSDLAKTIEGVLRQPLTKLSQGIDTLTAEQLEGVAKVIDGALEKFMTDIHKSHAAQVNALEKSLTSIAETVATLENLNKGAGVTALKQLAANSKGLGKSLDNVQKSLSEIHPLLKESAANQSEIRQLLKVDSSAAKVLQASSKDMAAAAKASRETVERFVLLAEKLRDFARVLTTTSSDNAASGAKPAEAKKALPPIGDPKTAQRLKQAIQELRKIAAVDAPDETVKTNE